MFQHSLTAKLIWEGYKKNNPTNNPNKPIGAPFYVTWFFTAKLLPDFKDKF